MVKLVDLKKITKLYIYIYIYIYINQILNKYIKKLNY
jgi:hypothetical protein